MSSYSFLYGVCNYVFIFLDFLGLTDLMLVLFPNEIALADVSVDQFFFACVFIFCVFLLVFFVIRLFFGLVRKFCEVISYD